VVEDELSDRQLIKQFQAGDLHAFSVFILRHQDRLTRIAATSIYVSANTEDVVQEVFLRAYKGLGKFRFGAEPFTWLYRTLKNVCMEMNRKQGQVLANQGRTDESIADGHDEYMQDLGTQLDNQRNIKKVRAFVACLPEKQREVIILRLFEGFSIKQTAKIIGCRTGTVKAHLHKAITNLRQSVNLKLDPKEFSYDG